MGETSGQNEFYEQQGVAMTCRSFKEYESMFACRFGDLKQQAVLDVAAGASSFTASARMQGIHSIAVDPMYCLNTQEMEERALREIELATEKLAKVSHLYRWDDYGSLEMHRMNRLQSLSLFIHDYRKDVAKEIYKPCSLPQLAFEDHSFSMVVCSHFLFLYEEQFDYAFHLAAIGEMMRVCRPGGEICLFPLLNFKRQPYVYLDELQQAIVDRGGEVAFPETHLTFMPEATNFLRIVKR